MAKKHPTTNKFEVPSNYYIDVNGGPSITFGHFRNSSYGECYVDVYKSLDKKHGNLAVQHIIKIGNFRVKNVQEMNTENFLKEIRKGIEEIINSSE